MADKDNTVNKYYTLDIDELYCYLIKLYPDIDEDDSNFVDIRIAMLRTSIRVLIKHLSCEAYAVNSHLIILSKIFCEDNKEEIDSYKESIVDNYQYLCENDSISSYNIFGLSSIILRYDYDKLDNNITLATCTTLKHRIQNLSSVNFTIKEG